MKLTEKVCMSLIGGMFILGSIGYPLYLTHYVPKQPAQSIRPVNQSSNTLSSTQRYTFTTPFYKTND